MSEIKIQDSGEGKNLPKECERKEQYTGKSVREKLKVLPGDGYPQTEGGGEIPHRPLVLVLKCPVCLAKYWPGLAPKSDHQIISKPSSIAF